MSNSETPELAELNIEMHSKTGSTDPSPAAKVYVIRIDKGTYKTPEPILTGQQILELAGKIPAADYKLTEKFHGGAAKSVGLADPVDLRAPGVERFMTMKRDQTEG